MQHNRLFKILIFILVIIISCLIFILFKIESKSHLMTKENQLVILSELGYTINDDGYIIKDDVFYLSFEIVRQLYPYMYQDADTLDYYIHTIDHEYHLAINNDIYVDGELMSYRFINERSDWFIPTNLFENLEIDVIELENNNFIIKHESISHFIGKMIEEFEFRNEEGYVIDRILVDDEVFILEQGYDDILYISPSGQIHESLINKMNISEIKGHELVFLDPINPFPNEPINLTFEAVYSSKINTEKIGDLGSVNVICPTWFEYVGSGEMSSSLDLDYIEWAKNNQDNIWPVFTSFNKDKTHELMNNKVNRSRIIEAIISNIVYHNLEGVNLDIENVYLKDKYAYVTFVYELSRELRELDKILSVDVTIMGGSEYYSLFLDRPAIARVADYLCIMSYDEHWSTSPISGSVSSYDWMKSGVEEIMEIVPKEKLLLGVPLYSREWSETISTKVVNKMDVKSKTLSIRYIDEYFEEHDYPVLWDNTDKQYYMAYFEDSSIKKVWFEEEKSIAYKTSLVNELGLPGVFTWQRRFGTEEIWNVIENVLNGDSPENY